MCTRMSTLFFQGGQFVTGRQCTFSVYRWRRHYRRRHRRRRSGLCSSEHSRTCCLRFAGGLLCAHSRTHRQQMSYITHVWTEFESTIRTLAVSITAVDVCTSLDACTLHATRAYRPLRLLTFAHHLLQHCSHQALAALPK